MRPQVETVTGLAVTNRVVRGHLDPVRFHVPALPDVDRFLDDARAIVESGSLSEGPYVRRLERRLSPWLGDRDVVMVSNCSDGLIAALAITAPPGSEVVIPGFTYLATWQAVAWAGMVPVVADVDDRGLLDPGAVEAALTSRTGAILAVHLTGTLAPMSRLRDIADGAGVALIADAAHALGARTGDVAAGTLGDVEVFSIGATKQVAAGEGGCLTIRDPALLPAARRWALQGHEPGAMDAVTGGMNLRLSELTAALALRQLDGLEEQLARREAIHARIAAGVEGLPLRLSGPRPGERSAHKDQLVWVDDPGDRAPIRDALRDAKIETKPYYDRAVPDLTAFEGRVASADVSRDLAARSFAVPIHARLTDEEVERVVAALRGYYGAA
ncbi:MAG: DegT/DnrJ/EryC1/StrS family aminotransferase [Chloroflexota bacterium]